MNKVFLGTELKLNINIEPLEGLTVDNFEVEIYCNKSKSITISSQDAILKEENNYVFRVDSNLIGSGVIKCKVTAYIPDSDFDDSSRTEVVIIDTGIEIIKSI